MKAPLLTILILLVAPLYGQDLTRKKKPVFVSHLSADNSALLRRKAAPKHNIFTRVICFKEKCRSFVGWRKNQKSIRFKGYRKGGALPQQSRPPENEKDPVIVRSTPVEPARPASDSVPATRLFVLDEVLFTHNSVRLNEALTYRLDSLAAIVMRERGVKVEITGHTDDTGSADHNLRLSQARAQSVAEYLIESGVDEKRIVFTGKGSAMPVASNDTDMGRARNRRVEILLSSSD